jgi:hypothetical protein
VNGVVLYGVLIIHINSEIGIPIKPKTPINIGKDLFICPDRASMICDERNPTKSKIIPAHQTVRTL